MSRMTAKLASVKTYTHSQGLSCCFRQHRADSHCHFLHGYALQVSVEFQCVPGQQDKNGWVVDFGAMKPFKKWLEETFDHKTLIAKDDPRRLELEHLRAIGVADVLVLEQVGMEAFAQLIMDKACEWLKEYLDNEHGTTECVRTRDVWVYRVCVNEHETNGVIAYGHR